MIESLICFVIGFCLVPVIMLAMSFIYWDNVMKTVGIAFILRLSSFIGLIAFVISLIFSR